jgi:5-methylcytosine-specific restriction endonuclease McrA
MRTYQAYKFTDEELENLKNGKCWCGKDRSQFQKGMKVYCSPEHREIWRKKVITWQEFKDSFLRRHGEYCDICGASNDDKAMKQQYEEYEKEVEEFISKYQDGIIARKLLKLEEDYEREYQKTINPKNIGYLEAENYAKHNNIPFPKLEDKRVQFEVDHKIAIVNGGDEFDVNNLQVLCQECHKKKTKNDLKISVRKNPMYAISEKEVTINMDNTIQSDELVENKEAEK